MKSYLYHPIRPTNEIKPLASIPKSELTELELEEIDTLAEYQMDELIESKISREELLGKDIRGIPIGFNPFFKLLRNDRLLRRQQFGPDEEYSPETILKLAIDQKIPYDNASSAK